MDKPVEAVGRDLSLQEKIILIMNELRATKDGENTFVKYKYFQPDTLLSLLNPLLKRYGILTKFNLLYKETHYTAELTLADKKDKEVYTFDILKATVKGANEAQNSGATLTYAKRYSLMNAFNIAENNDDFDSKPPIDEKEASAFDDVVMNINDFTDPKELTDKAKEIVANAKVSKEHKEQLKTIINNKILALKKNA